MPRCRCPGSTVTPDKCQPTGAASGSASSGTASISFESPNPTTRWALTATMKCRCGSCSASANSVRHSSRSPPRWAEISSTEARMSCSPALRTWAALMCTTIVAATRLTVTPWQHRYVPLRDPSTARQPCAARSPSMLGKVGAFTQKQPARGARHGSPVHRPYGSARFRGSCAVDSSRRRTLSRPVVRRRPRVQSHWRTAERGAL